MTVLLVALAATFGLIALVYLLHLIGFVLRGVGMTLGYVAVRILIIVGCGVGCWALLDRTGVL